MLRVESIYLVVGILKHFERKLEQCGAASPAYKEHQTGMTLTSQCKMQLAKTTREYPTPGQSNPSSLHRLIVQIDPSSLASIRRTSTTQKRVHRDHSYKSHPNHRQAHTLQCFHKNYYTRIHHQDHLEPEVWKIQWSLHSLVVYIYPSHQQELSVFIMVRLMRVWDTNSLILFCSVYIRTKQTP